MLNLLHFLVLFTVNHLSIFSSIPCWFVYDMLKLHLFFFLLLTSTMYTCICVQMCVCVCWLISLTHMWQGGFPTFGLVYIKTSFNTICGLWWIHFCVVMCWIMNELTYLPKCKITPSFQQSLIFRRIKYSHYLGFYINICMVNSISESSIKS